MTYATDISSLTDKISQLESELSKSTQIITDLEDEVYALKGAINSLIIDNNLLLLSKLSSPNG